MNAITDRYGRTVRPRNRIEAVLLPGAGWLDRHPNVTLVLLLATYLTSCAL